MSYNQYITARQQVPATAQTGVELWTELTGTNGLLSMAKSLPNTLGVNITGRDKLTIPSPWSSVISFDLLLDSTLEYGEVKTNTKNEWRTLMTIVALRKIRNIPLRFVTMNLADQHNSFCENILEQYPRNGIFTGRDQDGKEKDKKAWSSVTFIKLLNETVGMLTPSNLVCSPYTYNEDANNESIGWMIQNRLMERRESGGIITYAIKDPVDYILESDGVPQPTSVVYMCAWLNKIKSFLTDGGCFANQGNLVGRINDFLNDIKNAAEEKSISIGNLTLKENVAPLELSNAIELIENIQGEYSWIGLLVAMAYANLSDYNLTFVQNQDMSKQICEGMFHASVISDPTARAVLIDGQCVGVVRNNSVISVPTSPVNKAVVSKLYACGLMNEGAEYLDPANFILETPERYVYINEWFRFVRSQLYSMPGVTIGVITEIDEFLTRLSNMLLAKAANFQEDVRKLEQKYVSYAPGGGATIYDLFAGMIVTVDFDGAGIVNKSLIAGAKKANLVMFSQDTITADLMNFYRRSKEDTKVKVTMAQSNPVFNSDNVFEQKLFYIKIAESEAKRLNLDETKGWWNIKKTTVDGIDTYYTVLWPLKHDVFDLIDSSALYKGISYVYDADNDLCTVSLQLAVSGAMGQGSVITQTYDGPDKLGAVSSGVIDSYLLPGTSIWPYVKSDSADTSPWSSYFIYETKKTVYNNVSKLPNNYMIEYMPREDEIENVLELSSDLQEFKRTVKYRKTIPQYLIITDADTGTGIKNYYGAILLEEPTVLPRAGGADAEIGLDFGTSSTTVYTKIAGGPAQKVSFDDQVAYDPILHAYDDVSNYFMPKEYGDNNFYPSLLRETSNSNVPAINGIMLPSMTGNIIYQYKYSQSPDERNDRSTLKSNIKWDPISKTELQIYLRQIVMQSLLYVKKSGVSNVTWHASYPSAFSFKQMADYKSDLESIIDDIHTVSYNGHSDGLEFETESIAAAKYIVNTAAAQGYAYVTVIDIGGGSTDISAWQVGAGRPLPLFQSSVEIASRKIFLEPLKELIRKEEQLIKYIEDLGVPFNNIGTFIKNINNGKDAALNEKSFSTLVEQLLLLKGDEFKRTINTLKNLKNVQTFRKKVTIGFYAIMYYTVMSYNAAVTEKPTKMMISLGGNGAKLYDWLTQTDKETITKLIKSMINNGNIIVDVVFNKESAKTEAAQGLLESLGSVDVPDSFLLCGTEINLHYKDAEGNEMIETIKKDVNMWSNPIVKDCYDAAVNAVGERITMTDDYEMCRDFIRQVESEIYDNTIKLNINELETKARVQAEMGGTLKTKRMSSPLFSQIMCVIDSIE